MPDGGGFTKKVANTLAKRAAYQCSRPTCRKITVGPTEGPDGSKTIGVAAHIRAKSPGGARYDPKQTLQDRASVKNGLWLCEDDGKEIDSDRDAYSVELLTQWKVEHENNVAEAFGNATKFVRGEIVYIDGLQVGVEGKGLGWVKISRAARLGIREDRLYNVPNVRLINNEPNNILIEFRLRLSTDGHEPEEFVSIDSCLFHEVGGLYPAEGPVQHLPRESPLRPRQHVRGHVEFLVHGYYDQINPSDTGISEKVTIIDLLTNREQIIINNEMPGLPTT